MFITFFSLPLPLHADLADISTLFAGFKLVAIWENDLAL